MLRFLVAVVIAVAVGLHRHASAVALGLVWVAGGLQLLSGTTPMTVLLAAGIVAYGAARFGSRTTMIASALSIPVAAVIGIWFMVDSGSAVFGVTVPDPTALPQIQAGYSEALIGSVYYTTGSLVAITLLALPWLLGYALRERAQRKQSLAELHALQQGLIDGFADGHASTWLAEVGAELVASTPGRRRRED